MARLPKPLLCIGTSGWMYKDWGERFYPKDLKTGHLSYLAREFNTVEINSSFYHLPRSSTFAKWQSEVPDHFVFAAKMSRYVTHRKRLHAVGEPIATFMARAQKLGDKLGVVLVQLPPSLKYDKQRLVALLRLLGRKKARFAIEPRHKSWLEAAEEVRKLLHTINNVGLVFPHSAKLPSFAPEDANITSNFVYVRFHGPSEFGASRYGAAKLRPWARRIQQWHKRGLSVFAYFNNDKHGHAIDDARTLKRLVGNY